MYTKSGKVTTHQKLDNNTLMGYLYPEFQKLTRKEIESLHPAEKLKYYRWLSKNAKIGKKK